VIGPDGDNSTLDLQSTGPGLWETTIEKPMLGLWQFANGDLRALAHAGPVNAREYREILSTTDVMADYTAARGGATLRLASANNAVDLPRIQAVRQGTRAQGNGWIGLERTDETRLIGLARLPLFAGLLGLALILAMLSTLWYREGR
jgi:hypothetical protein